VSKLSREQHARIFNAFLNGLTLKDLETIFQAQRDAWKATMTLGNSAQIEAQKHANEITEQAMDRFLDYELRDIEEIIKNVLQEAAHA